MEKAKGLTGDTHRPAPPLRGHLRGAPGPAGWADTGQRTGSWPAQCSLHCTGYLFLRHTHTCKDINTKAVATLCLGTERTG